MRRRSLLQMIGMAPVAATVSPALPPAPEPVSAAYAMSGSLYRGGVAMAGENARTPLAALKEAITKYTKRKARDTIEQTVRPDWWVKRHRRDAHHMALEIVYGRNSNYVDPNIMSLKSASPAAKVRMLADKIQQHLEAQSYADSRLQKLLWDLQTGNLEEDSNYYDH
jgi:hypothetical protein